MNHPNQQLPVMQNPVRPPDKTGTFYTPVFQLSFPHLDQPWQGENLQGEPAFMVTAIFDDKANLQEMTQELMKTLVKKFGTSAPTMVRAGALKFALRPKMQKANFQGYEGDGYFCSLRARSQTPMICLDYTSGKPVIVNQGMRDATFYPGSYCYAAYQPFAYEKGGGKGCSLSLRTVVKVADGERLGGGTPVTEQEALAAVQGVVIPGIVDARQPEVEGTADEIPPWAPDSSVVPAEADLLAELFR